MAIDITSLFQDILESPEQKQQRQVAEGFVRSKNAVSQLTGLAAAAAPLVGTMAELQDRRTEALQKVVGGLLGRDVRSTSERLQDALSQFNPQDPRSVSQTTQMLQGMGLGAQGAQLAGMAFDEQQKTKALDLAQKRADRELELRKEEIALAKERAEQMAVQQTDFTRRLIAEATNESINQQALAVNMLRLSTQYELTPPKSGYSATAVSAWREFLGSQGGEDAVRQDYIKLRNEAIISGLPRGSASDTDIQIAMSGWPSDTANANYLSAFMRGQAKLAALSAEMNSVKASYISSNNGNLAGFVEYWDKTSSDENFIKGVEDKYKILFAEPSSQAGQAEKLAGRENLWIELFKD